MTRMSRLGALLCLTLCSAPLLAQAPQDKPSKKDALIAGKAEVLRHVPKRFATLTAADVANRRVTLLVEGENLAKVWSLAADAEIKVAGWWGRLDQLTLGDRVWVWFNVDRKQQPINILMLADEISEQEIHGPGYRVEALTLSSQEGTPAELKIRNPLDEVRALKVALKEVQRGAEKAPLAGLKPGEAIFVQTAAGQARLILDPAAFERRQTDQKAALRQRWRDDGLPGTVLFLHLSGEMELMLDHETMRWARALKPGDKVTLKTANPISGQVQQVRPWRERTQVRLVVGGFDLADLAPGQRVALAVPPPPADIDNALLPADLERPRSKEERIEWFLASIYCPCKVKKDACTGDFYTLASCNPNACGMPNQMRKIIAAKIDKGLNDKQIFDELLKEQGPGLLRQHLVP